MPRFSANISTLFTEVPFLERIELARKAGFDAIEIQFPYGEKPATIRSALEAANLPLVLFNCPAGDFMTGGPGIAAIAGKETEFLDAIKTAHHYATVLEPHYINVLSGRHAPGLDRDRCLSVLASNLNTAVDLFEDLQTNIVTEAINTNDVPGFLLPCSAQVRKLMDKVDGLGMQFDLYHMAQMEGNLAAGLKKYLSDIRHLQFADCPGRHEPGTGEIEFTRLFNLIDELEYPGFVGAEYHPLRDTESSLGWLPG